MEINSWWNYRKKIAYNYKTNKNGWSNREIANALGYTIDSVQCWMSGRVIPGDKAIHNICSLLEVDEEIGAERFREDHENYLKMIYGDQITIDDCPESDTPTLFNDLSDHEQMEIIVQRLNGVDCEAIINYLDRVRIAGSCIIRRTKQNKLAYGLLDLRELDRVSVETTFDIYERLRDLILEELNNGSRNTN